MCEAKIGLKKEEKKLMEERFAEETPNIAMMGATLLDIH